MKDAKQYTLRITALIKAILILFILIVSDTSFTKENKNTQYIIQNGDSISLILKMHKLLPVYGKNGYLNELLKLNPNTIQEDGNLIYPGDIIILPTKRLDISIEDSISYGEYSSSISKFKSKFDNFKGNSEYVYMVYTVQNGDIISILLQNLGAVPIYGIHGSLNFTLELNPNKRKTSGDLIFPKEKLLLFIPIKVALKILEDNKNIAFVLKDKPKKLNSNLFRDKNNFYTYDELNKKHQEILIKKGYEDKLEIDLKEKDKMDFGELNKPINSEESDKFKSEIIKEENPYNNENIADIKINPILLTGKIVDDKVKLNWNEMNKDYSNMYEIKRSLKSKNSYYSIKKYSTRNEFYDLKTIPGNQYFYTVILHYGKDRIERSNEISIITPPEPPKLSISLKKGYVQLKWKTKNNFKAFKYEILKANNAIKNFTSIQQNYTQTIFNDKEITPGSSYFYKIRIYYENKIIVYSNIVKTETPQLKPKLFGSLLKNSIKLSWTSSQGNKSLKYEIKRSFEKGNNYTQIAKDIVDNYYFDSSIQKGFTYYYIVSVYDEENSMIQTNEVKVSALPATPNNFIAEFDLNNNLKLSWSIEEGNNSLKYILSRSLKSKQEYEIIQDNLKEKSVIDYSAQKGQKYFYIITAIDKNGNLQDSSEISIITPPQTPANFKAELVGNVINLQWDEYKSNIEKHYIIKRTSIKDEDYLILDDNINGNSFVDNSILPQETYTYILIAENESGQSLESNKVTVNSHFGEHTANSLGVEFAVSYFTFKENNKSIGSHDTFYSSASPLLNIEHIHNWTDHAISYFDLGFIFLDVSKSPIYEFPQRQFYLFHTSAGARFDLNNQWYLHPEYSLSEKVLFQTDGYNQLTNLIKNFQSIKLLNGYTFYKYDSLKAQVEIGPTLTVPLQFSINNLAFGYEASLKLTQQNKNFGLEGKLFYRSTQFITNEVKSQESEIGLSGEFIFDIGFQ
ncbi:LysM peptidoglycan-binding domain-containing protein [Fluviispira multicolorata]|uniref:Fibronectin type-III domain-containing protein n=1 Tax=Fluviispira multicolorata TaxID=2654512 RepID=A0A833JFG6_9BACT|nr:LysM peptidoglycan-binding domain-containing protein [Fluviispira multicolorata]KAB8033734.1 hypothetical protein GCL57_03230 [Fluviispira multicolorata]